MKIIFLLLYPSNERSSTIYKLMNDGIIAYIDPNFTNVILNSSAFDRYRRLLMREHIITGELIKSKLEPRVFCYQLTDNLSNFLRLRLVDGSSYYLVTVP